MLVHLNYYESEIPISNSKTLHWIVVGQDSDPHSATKLSGNLGPANIAWQKNPCELLFIVYEQILAQV